MTLPQSTSLAKLTALLALAALVLFIAAFSTNHWLEKYFFFPVNAGGVATIPVSANIGLFTACKVEYYPNNRSFESCSPDGAADWQKISAGLDVAALVLAVIGTVVAFLAVILNRLASGLRAKLGILLCYVLTCGFSVGPLIMMPINRTIQVRPNLSEFQANFDLGWSYIVAAVSTGIFALLVLLNTIDIVWMNSLDEKHRKEDKNTLRTDRYSFSTEFS